MHRISLRTAVAITGLTKRTLWRRIHNGRLAAISATEPGEKTLVRLEDVLPMSFLAVTPEDGDSLPSCLGIQQSSILAKIDPNEKYRIPRWARFNSGLTRYRQDNQSPCQSVSLARRKTSAINASESR